jgi:hypothetical protein
METLGIQEMKLLWIFGALERLATLGFIQEPPYRVTQDTIDTYLKLDEYRNNLFPDESELKIIMTSIIKDQNGYADPDLVEGFYILLLDFKNERERLVKHGLSHSFSL